jgi:3-methyladenine DNA glycosylase AlkC
MKTCSKCHIEKDEIEFPLNKGKGTYRAGSRKAMCKVCYRAYNKIYHKKRYPKDKEKIIQRAGKWQKENKNKYRKISNDCLRKRLLELSDSYIKGFLNSDAKRRGVIPIINSEMIEIKRLLIQFKRKIKNNEN